MPAYVDLTVLRLNNTIGTVTVGYATRRWHATAGTNYTAVSGTLTFTNGQDRADHPGAADLRPHVTGDLLFRSA